MNKLVVAIFYDFDKTLAYDDMQSFSFIPKLNQNTEQFWGAVRNFANKNKCEPILAYLQVMLEECKRAGIKLTKEYLTSLGKDIKFYPGVTTWFDRINAYANKLNIQLNHYVISSGNKEMIEGCKIADKFTDIFGCEFLYDKDGIAYWPKNIINYTLKTQYLFRICKGTTDITDSRRVNDRISKKYIEFRNMIYIGDGLTDIPCMTLVKEKGGTAISVYPQDKKEASIKLLADDRVNYATKSDYSSNSQLEKLTKLILDNISYRESLLKKENKIKNKP